MAELNPKPKKPKNPGKEPLPPSKTYIKNHYGSLTIRNSQTLAEIIEEIPDDIDYSKVCVDKGYCDECDDVELVWATQEELPLSEIEYRRALARYEQQVINYRRKLEKYQDEIKAYTVALEKWNNTEKHLTETAERETWERLNKIYGDKQ